MPKRKQKKAGPATDPLKAAKLLKLQGLLKDFKTQCEQYENHLTATCQEENEQIRKLYRDKLAMLPVHMRTMTIPEVLAHQQKEKNRSTECPKDENAIRNMFERQRATTEKRRTQKKERKRSTSANATARPLTISKQQPQLPSAFPRISRALSDPSLATPLSRFARVSNLNVTPKFDPSIPVSKMARKPKPNEIVMSISGSPLQNMVDDTKPHLSLGHGKVLTFDEESKIDKDFVKKLDEPMKKMLQEVKDKLDKILQGD